MWLVSGIGKLKYSNFFQRLVADPPFPLDVEATEDYFGAAGIIPVGLSKMLTFSWLLYALDLLWNVSKQD